MLTRIDRSLYRCAAAVAIGVSIAAAAAAEPPRATVANLQIAFATDVAAGARYTAYADRAEQEGLPEVAALFRAAAHAEGVRARLHGDVLRRAGREPLVPSPPPPAVSTTRANLLSVLGQENTERTSTYPRFIDQARRDGAPEAVLAFTLAHHAEEGLVRLHQDAVATPRARRGAGVFHVCETCGHVVQGPPPERCPVSLTPRSGFTRVP